MTDRHRQDKTTFRPPPEVKKAAQDVLAGRTDWTMNEFLTACLVLLTRNPDAMLARLNDVRPERQRGRPPKVNRPGGKSNKSGEKPN